jgi:diaminopropionate ammonia-lyase
MHRVVRNPLRNSMRWAPPPSAPLDFHRQLAGYDPTPLHDMPLLASELGVGRLLVKDESHRLGLSAFKVLGASWAIYRALAERLDVPPRPGASADELEERFASLRPLTLATASAGNHGLAVARIARILGFQARVWVPSGTSAARIAAIRAEGADVDHTAESYDAAVRDAVAAAGPRTLVVSDTAWPGFEITPQWVIDGYSTLLWEIDEQLAMEDLPEPDVVIVPIGVGALAAAVARHHRRLDRPDRTVLIGVEPVGAACVTASMLAGRMVSISGGPDSTMAGLNCGTPSSVAWPRVASGFDWMVLVSDPQAEAAVRRLAEHGIEAGASGAATLAALETGSMPLAERTVLLLMTEGVIHLGRQGPNTELLYPVGNLAQGGRTLERVGVAAL